MGAPSAVSLFVRPAGRDRTLLGQIMGAAFFCALTALGAQVKVPLPWTDVPMTLQPLPVLLAGLLLTPGVAASSMLLYAGVGAAGLPVFTPGSAGIFGPTGGYIVGFVAGAGLVGLLRGGAGAGLYRLATAGFAGMLCVFAFGLAWRTVLFGGDLAAAVATGLLPFVAKAIVEVLLAAAMARQIHRAFGGAVEKSV